MQPRCDVGTFQNYDVRIHALRTVVCCMLIVTNAFAALAKQYTGYEATKLTMALFPFPSSHSYRNAVAFGNNEATFQNPDVRTHFSGTYTCRVFTKTSFTWPLVEFEIRRANGMDSDKRRNENTTLKQSAGTLSNRIALQIG